jgi:hypothetical protein
VRKIIEAIRYWVGAIKQPKHLELTQDQAEYVQGLFLGGAAPDEIGRAMDKTYGRKTWDYFKLPGHGGAFEFTSTVDYEIDGLEYLRAAMIKLGAIVVRKDTDGKYYDYYQGSHAMVQKIAGIAASAPIPEKRG